jgi:hypothetical protein
MISKLIALAAAVALVGGTLVAATSAEAAKCKTHYGKGWAPTKDMAKFQSWEITAQVTGNWPFMSDTFRNERYKCKPDGSGWECRSAIDVCRS